MAQVFDRGLVLSLKLGSIIALALLVTLLFAWRWSTDYPHAVAAPRSSLYRLIINIMCATMASIAATAIRQSRSPRLRESPPRHLHDLSFTAVSGRCIVCTAKCNPLRLAASCPTLKRAARTVIHFSTR
jgi:hypothetical protein